MKLLALILTTAIGVASHALEIVIDRGTTSLTRIGVVPFAMTNGASDPSTIVHRDMARSGQFLPIDSELMLNIPTSPDQVVFRDWQTQKVDFVILGTSTMDGNGNCLVDVHMVDVTQEQLLRSVRFSAAPSAFRAMGHRISDVAYETLTGVPGAFSTRLLYVLAQGRDTATPRYRMEVSDSDGENARTLVDGPHPLLSPTWSPDGTKIAYVSFDTGESSVYTHDLITNERRLVANFEGVNGAPAFSPDGTKLALTLSRDGNPEVYTLDLATGVLRRITSHWGIDTESVWTSDNDLVFTSDRSGGPQVYRVDLRSLLPKRLTFVGDYNARPRVLPEEDRLIYVHQDDDNDYHIVWQNLEGDTRPRILTSNPLDESPSVAPNGMMVIYSTRWGGKGILAIVSVDGDVEFRLPAAEGDAMEPAWSPFLAASEVHSVDL